MFEEGWETGPSNLNLIDLLRYQGDSNVNVLIGESMGAHCLMHWLENEREYDSQGDSEKNVAKLDGITSIAKSLGALSVKEQLFHTVRAQKLQVGAGPEPPGRGTLMKDRRCGVCSYVVSDKSLVSRKSRSRRRTKMSLIYWAAAGAFLSNCCLLVHCLYTTLIIVQ